MTTRIAFGWGWVFAGMLFGIWLGIGIGLSLVTRQTVSTVAQAIAQNEATRRSTLNAWIDSTCPGRLLNPLRLPIVDTLRSPRP